MKNLEKILKALANKRRLAILKFLKSEKEAPVNKIAKEIKLSFKSTSKHLTLLAAADIIDKEQRSSQVFYRLADKLPTLINNILTIL